MEAEVDIVWIAREPTPEWGAKHVPPQVDRPPYTLRELHELFKGGEPEADRCERTLASGARVRNGIDLALGEGLLALQQGDRLPQLGYHLTDYAREVVGVSESTARKLVHLARELRSRPLLREAVRSGRVTLRAAQTVLPVARGEDEAGWVERAERETIRALQAAVRAGGKEPEPQAEEPWVRLRVEIDDEARAIVDEALEIAARILPGSRTEERFEALAQEFLGSHPTPLASEAGRWMSPVFQPVGPGRAARKEALETETDRFCLLPPVEPFPAPDPRFEEATTADEIDTTLRELCKLRDGWDDVIGFCACAIKESRIYERFGFTDFGHYCEERLGLPSRSVEQRTALEKRLWSSPPLQEARRQKLSYEKLRLLCRLPDSDIGSWTPRAHALTCIALRRRLDQEHARQMRTRGRIGVRLPLRTAEVVDAAMQAVRDASGCQVLAGRCLAVLASHFLSVWKGAVPRKTPSQRLRERDGGWCTVPGCSRRATDEHHVLYRSHGGGDEPENKTGVCRFHHLRVIHAGFLKVFGRAPDGLTWLHRGEPWPKMGR